MSGCDDMLRVDEKSRALRSIDQNFPVVEPVEGDQAGNFLD